MIDLSQSVGEAATVLLVDDDAGARRGLSHYLKGCLNLHPALRVACIEASSGEGAIAVVREQEIDFVFLDYHMADMNGLDCLNRLVEHNPDLPIALLTGEDSTKVATEAIKRGACDYVLKMEATVEEVHRTLWKGLEWGAMRRRIRSQAGQLVEAEDQRVMMESMAAACHHLGQPATVIETCVALLKKETKPDQVKALLDDVQVAADHIAGILKRMEGLRAYRTEPYLPTGQATDTSRRILVL